MTPRERDAIIATLRNEHRRNGGEPVTTRCFARHHHQHPHHIIRKLKELEEAGTIERVGERGGWLPLKDRD